MKNDQPHGLRVLRRYEKRLGGLSGERATALVDDRAGDEDGYLGHVVVLEERANGIDGRLRVRRVEDGLDQNHVDTVLEEMNRLLLVRGDELVEC